MLEFNDAINVLVYTVYSSYYAHISSPLFIFYGVPIVYVPACGYLSFAILVNNISGGS